jgi:peroxiredoxin
MNDYHEPSVPSQPPSDEPPPLAPAPDAVVPPAPPSSNGKWVALAALGVAVILFLAGRNVSTPAGHTPATTTAEACHAASTAPAKLDFSIKDMNGAQVKLADYKGKVILMNFWATWCGPCKMEIPAFVQLYDQYKDRGFVILGISTDDEPDALKSYAQEYRMNYPVLVGRDREDLLDAYGPIYGIPTSYFITRDGAICKKHMGPATKEEFEQTIKSLL